MRAIETVEFIPWRIIKPLSEWPTRVNEQGEKREFEQRAYAIGGGGAGPKITEYRENAGQVGATRSLNSLLAWAESRGVTVPDYARVLPVSSEDVQLVFRGEQVFARYFSVGHEVSGADRVYWNNPADPIMSIMSRKLGVVGIIIDESIMDNDEKFLHFLAHEVYELTHIKEYFDQSQDGSLSVYHFYGLTAASHHFAKNLHSDAWDYADSCIMELRREI